MSIFVSLLTLGFFALLILAMMAPFEALGWWAGWSDQRNKVDKLVAHTPTAEDERDDRHFVVFLSGIGDISRDDDFFPEESKFLDRLAHRLPDMVLVRDIFPYSVTNNPLTGQRAFASFWRWLQRLRIDGDKTISFLINVRNLFQVTVSADNRYGPIYNYGSAEVIYQGLVRHGYRRGSGAYVTLIGSSGGGQISLGSVTYLAIMVGKPVRVISIGGVMCSDPGVNRVEHLYHLYGERDVIQKLGEIVFPSRWSIMPHSDWNRAMAAGMITFVSTGDMVHNGQGGYFGTTNELPDGRTNMDVTVDIVTELIQKPWKYETLDALPVKSIAAPVATS